MRHSILSQVHLPERPRGWGYRRGEGRPRRRTHASAAGPAQAAYQASLDRMHQAMGPGILDPDANVAFDKGMIAHHEAASRWRRSNCSMARTPPTESSLRRSLQRRKRKWRKLSSGWRGEGFVNPCRPCAAARGPGAAPRRTWRRRRRGWTQGYPRTPASWPGYPCGSGSAPWRAWGDSPIR